MSMKDEQKPGGELDSSKASLLHQSGRMRTSSNDDEPLQYPVGTIGENLETKRRSKKEHRVSLRKNTAVVGITVDPKWGKEDYGDDFDLDFDDNEGMNSGMQLAARLKGNDDLELDLDDLDFEGDEEALEKPKERTRSLSSRSLIETLDDESEALFNSVSASVKSLESWKDRCETLLEASNYQEPGVVGPNVIDLDEAKALHEWKVAYSKERGDVLSESEASLELAGAYLASASASALAGGTSDAATSRNITTAIDILEDTSAALLHLLDPKDPDADALQSHLADEGVAADGSPGTRTSAAVEKASEWMMSMRRQSWGSKHQMDASRAQRLIAQCHLTLGRVHKRRNNFVVAAEVLETAVPVAASRELTLLLGVCNMELGILAADAKDHRTAIRHLTSFLEAAPKMFADDALVQRCRRRSNSRYQESERSSFTQTDDGADDALAYEETLLGEVPALVAVSCVECAQEILRFGGAFGLRTSTLAEELASQGVDLAARLQERASSAATRGEQKTEPGFMHLLEGTVRTGEEVIDNLQRARTEHVDSGDWDDDDDEDWDAEIARMEGRREGGALTESRLLFSSLKASLATSLSKDTGQTVAKRYCLMHQLQTLATQPAIIKYPKSTYLFSLRTEEGLRLYTEKAMETYLREIVQKHARDFLRGPPGEISYNAFQSSLEYVDVLSARWSELYVNFCLHAYTLSRRSWVERALREFFLQVQAAPTRMRADQALLRAAGNEGRSDVEDDCVFRYILDMLHIAALLWQPNPRISMLGEQNNMFMPMVAAARSFRRSQLHELSVDLIFADAHAHNTNRLPKNSRETTEGTYARVFFEAASLARSMYPHLDTPENGGKSPDRLHLARQANASSPGGLSDDHGVAQGYFGGLDAPFPLKHGGLSRIDESLGTSGRMANPPNSDAADSAWTDPRPASFRQGPLPIWDPILLQVWALTHLQLYMEDISPLTLEPLPGPLGRFSDDGTPSCCVATVGGNVDPSTFSDSDSDGSTSGDDEFWSDEDITETGIAAIEGVATSWQETLRGGTRNSSWSRKKHRRSHSSSDRSVDCRQQLSASRSTPAIPILQTFADGADLFIPDASASVFGTPASAPGFTMSASPIRPMGPLETDDSTPREASGSSFVTGSYLDDNDAATTLNHSGSGFPDVVAAVDTLLADTNARIACIRGLYVYVPVSSFLKVHASFAMGHHALHRINDSPLAERLLFEAVFVADHCRSLLPAGTEGGPPPLLTVAASPLLLGYGDALLENGKYKYAVLAYESAVLSHKLRLRSDCPTLNRSLADICHQQADINRALSYYSKILEECKERPNARAQSHMGDDDAGACRAAIEYKEPTSLESGHARDRPEGDAASSDRRRIRIRDGNLAEFVYVSEIISKMHAELGQFRESEGYLLAALSELTNAAAPRDADAESSRNSRTRRGLPVRSSHVDSHSVQIQLQLARLYLDGYQIEKCIALLEGLVTASLPHGKRAGVLALLASAYHKRRAQSECARVLDWLEVEVRSLIDAAAEANAELRRDSRRVWLTARRLPTHWGNKDIRPVSTQPPEAQSGNLGLQDLVEVGIERIRLMRARNAFAAKNYVAALQHVEAAVLQIFCGTGLDVSVGASKESARIGLLGRIYYLRGKILQDAVTTASHEFPITIEPDPVSVTDNGETTTLPSLVFETDSDALREALWSFRKAHSYFRMVVDDIRMAKCQLRIAEMLLDRLFPGVVLLGQPMEEAASLRLPSTPIMHLHDFVRSASTSQHPSAANSATASPRASKTSKSADTSSRSKVSPARLSAVVDAERTIRKIGLDAIDSAATSALDLSADALQPLMLIRALLVVAELRHLQKRCTVAVAYWTEAKDAFVALFLDGPTVPLVQGAPPSFVEQLQCVLGRLVRFVFAYDDLLQKNHLLLDAYVNLLTDAERTLRLAADPVDASVLLSSCGSDPGSHPSTLRRAPMPSSTGGARPAAGSGSRGNTIVPSVHGALTVGRSHHVWAKEAREWSKRYCSTFPPSNNVRSSKRVNVLHLFDETEDSSPDSTVSMGTSSMDSQTHTYVWRKLFRIRMNAHKYNQGHLTVEDLRSRNLNCILDIWKTMRQAALPPDFAEAVYSARAPSEYPPALFVLHLNDLVLYYVPKTGKKRVVRLTGCQSADSGAIELGRSCSEAFAEEVRLGSDHSNLSSAEGDGGFGGGVSSDMQRKSIFGNSSDDGNMFEFLDLQFESSTTSPKYDGVCRIIGFSRSDTSESRGGAVADPGIGVSTSEGPDGRCSRSVSSGTAALVPPHRSSSSTGPSGTSAPTSPRLGQPTSPATPSARVRMSTCPPDAGHGPEGRSSATVNASASGSPAVADGGASRCSVGSLRDGASPLLSSSARPNMSSLVELCRVRPCSAAPWSTEAIDMLCNIVDGPSTSRVVSRVSAPDLRRRRQILREFSRGMLGDPSVVTLGLGSPGLKADLFSTMSMFHKPSAAFLPPRLSLEALGVGGSLSPALASKQRSHPVPPPPPLLVVCCPAFQLVPWELLLSDFVVSRTFTLFEEMKRPAQCWRPSSSGPSFAAPRRRPSRALSPLPQFFALRPRAPSASPSTSTHANLSNSSALSPTGVAPPLSRVGSPYASTPPWLTTPRTTRPAPPGASATSACSRTRSPSTLRSTPSALSPRFPSGTPASKMSCRSRPAGGRVRRCSTLTAQALGKLSCTGFPPPTRPLRLSPVPPLTSPLVKLVGSRWRNWRYKRFIHFLDAAPLITTPSDIVTLMENHTSSSMPVLLFTFADLMHWSEIVFMLLSWTDCVLLFVAADGMVRLVDFLITLQEGLVRGHGAVVPGSASFKFCFVNVILAFCREYAIPIAVFNGPPPSS
eukprot:Rmarinus@m.29936